MNGITLSIISGHVSNVFPAPESAWYVADDRRARGRDREAGGARGRNSEASNSVSPRRSRARVPSRLTLRRDDRACSGFTSGMIIGTSGVARCAPLFETTGVSLFAYASSSARVSSFVMSTAQNTKSTSSCDGFDVRCVAHDEIARRTRDRRRHRPTTRDGFFVRAPRGLRARGDDTHRKPRMRFEERDESLPDHPGRAKHTDLEPRSHAAFYHHDDALLKFHACVSVILPYRDAAKTIVRAVASVLAETRRGRSGRGRRRLTRRRVFRRKKHASCTHRARAHGGRRRGARAFTSGSSMRAAISSRAWTPTT